MERYKQTIQKRRMLVAVLCVFMIGIGLYDVFFASEAIRESPAFSFQAGFSAALGVLFAVQMIRYGMMLRDETKLRLAYNKSNDERLQAIRAKAGMPLLMVASVCMIVAGILAGYFDVTISITLIVAAVFQLLLGISAKLFYTRKI